MQGSELMSGDPGNSLLLWKEHVGKVTRGGRMLDGLWYNEDVTGALRFNPVMLVQGQRRIYLTHGDKWCKLKKMRRLKHVEKPCKRS